MKSLDLLRHALTFTDEGTARLAADLRAHPLTPRGGNHALWTLGHLALVEGFFHEMITRDANPVAHWAPLFAPGTQPSQDASIYPGFDELLQKLRSLRARTLALLDQLGDAGLDRAPHNPPPALADSMPTLAHAFMLIALHQMSHNGQLADARRAAGLKPLM